MHLNIQDETVSEFKKLYIYWYVVNIKGYFKFSKEWGFEKKKTHVLIRKIYLLIKRKKQNVSIKFN